MVLSEIIANIQIGQNRIGTTQTNTRSVNHSNKFVISNFIPFKTVHFIFAFSIIATSVIKAIQQTQIGFPYMSIQTVIMLICLLFSNYEAKSHLKRQFDIFYGLV